MLRSIRSKYWKPIDISRSGRPILNQSEAEILIQDNIGLYQDIVKLVDNQNGRVYLTDERIIYIDRESNSQGEVVLNSKNKSKKETNHPNIYLNLLDIESVELYAGFLKSSAKVIITLKPIAKPLADTNSNNVGNKSENSDESHTRRDSFVESLYSKPPLVKHDVNWVCPICYFSNILTTENIQKIDNNDNQTLPKCQTCGVKAPRDLIENIINSETTYLENLTPNVVSKDGFHCPKCTFINHPSLTYCEMCGTRLLSSNLPPSVLQSSFGDDGNKLADAKSEEEQGLEFLTEDYALEDELNTRIIKLSFRKSGSKSFYEKLLSAVEMSKWKRAKSQNKINEGAIKLTREEVNSSKSSRDLVNRVESQVIQENKRKSNMDMAPIMGIHGLETSNSLQSQEDFMLLNNSVQDLENLMSKAKELIELSESYQKVLINSRTATTSSKINKNLDILQNSKTSIKILDNIITKNDFMKSYSTSKNTKALWSLKNNDSNSKKGNKSGLPLLYIEELARQIYEFVTDENLLDKSNGLITLYDLFIVYNRARGINLISPLELFDAVSIFGDLKLNMKVIEIIIPKKQQRQQQQQQQLQSKDDDKFYILSKREVSSNSVSQKIIKHLVDLSKQTNGKTTKKSKKDYGQSVLMLQNQPNLKMNYLILSTLLTNLTLNGSICVDQRIQGEFYYADEMTGFDWDRDYFNQEEEEPETAIVDDDRVEYADVLDNEPIVEIRNEEPNVVVVADVDDDEKDTTKQEAVKVEDNYYVSDTLKELQGLSFE